MSSTTPPQSQNSLLLVAFHFPPQTGSSGLLRSLKFSRYLPEFGWQPLVLTANPRAYESTDPQKGTNTESVLPVLRAFALDTKRHLGFQPRVFDPESPNHFRCAFATAEGWGSYEEKSDAGRKNAQVTVKYGKLRLRTLELAGADSSAASLAEVKLNGRSISLKHSQTERRVRITFDEELEISAPQNLEVTIA